jgi:lipid A 3-O-deacylase
MVGSLSRLRTILVFFCFAIFLAGPPYAKANQTDEALTRPEVDLYAKGRVSLQLVSGALFSLTNLPGDSPVFNYAQTNLRLGWMLTNPGPQEDFFRGNWEGLVEVSNSIIFKGFGNYIGGITVLFRYNFVQPDWKIIPYVQGGAGIVYNDAYKDETQQAIGQAIEFTPQFSLGLHYLIARHWSLDAEGMFHHISNAGMSKRNRSINALGGFLGITYFFD